MIKRETALKITGIVIVLTISALAAVFALQIYQLAGSKIATLVMIGLGDIGLILFILLR
jgi:hypothetical protein